MQVESVEIAKNTSYSTKPGQFKGTCQLTDDNNSITVALSPKVLSRIFQVIAEDVKEQAMRVASATPRAMEEAEHAPMLLESSKI